MLDEKVASDTSAATQRLRELRELAALVGRNVTGKPLRDAIVDHARRLFHADAVALWRHESRTRVWRVAAATGLSTDYTAIEIPGEEGRLTDVVPEPIMITDPLRFEAVGSRLELYEREGIACLLVLPLRIRGELNGTISCYYRQRIENLGADELALAAAFGEIASVALTTERFDKLPDIARDVAGRLDLDAVVQSITDAGTELTGAQFGAFFYNVIDQRGESYTLYAISGVPREAFSRFPMPRNTHIFAPTFAGEGTVRSANITKDPRYGQNAPYHGMPKGHLPVVSYLAVPVIARSGEVLGGLFFGHSQENVFGETEEKVVEALASHASVAIENVRLYERLERDRAALRQDERRYRSLVFASPTRQIVVLIDANGELKSHAEGWRELTGQSDEEATGRGWADVIHPNDRDRVLSGWQAATQARAVFEETYLIRLRDGSYRWFAAKAVPLFDDDGSLVEWIATVTDVHEQHVAQDGLRFLAEVNEMFSSSLDYRETLKNVTRLAVPRIGDWCAVDMVDESDPSKTARLSVAHIDPQKVALAEEFHRRYPPDPEHDAVARVLRSGESELVQEIPDELLVQAAKSDDHLRMLRALGLMSYIVVPLRSRGQNIGAITLVASDRRFTEQDLSHADELARRASIAIENARLYGAAQAANRAKDEFLATLSHELRTPMTSVLGWARMLKLGLTAEEATAAIDAIEQGATTQAQLIEDVLDVSRIMSGKLTFEPRVVNVATAARAAVTTVHPAAVAKGIEILTSIPPVLPAVSGDEGRLQQIIWNLLSNAIKFTPRGGTVTLRVVHEGSLIRISVSDTGQGIERSFLPYVFEPFRQADSSTTRSHGGIGLGLAIVRSLVELHGGRISATSEGLGKGATFSMELPVLESAPVLGRRVEPEPLTAPTAAARKLPSLADLNVLVIDDQEFTRDIVAAILRAAGARVTTAASVREALELLPRVQPHVVACDIAMPQEDGYVFLREIREREDAMRNLPIMALTAFGRPEDRRRALDAGFDAYLKKPVDPAELAEAIQRLSVER